MRSRLIWFVAVVVLLAACGGGGDSDSDGGSLFSDAVGGDSGSTSSDDNDGGGDDGDDGGGGVAGISADGDWCAGAAQIQARVDAIEAQDLPLQEQLRQQFGEVLNDQLVLLRNSPAAISDDATRYADGLVELADLFKSVDYNLFALSDDDSALLEDPALEEAGDNVERYLEEACNIDTDGSDGDDSLQLSDDEVDSLLDGDDRDQVLGALMALGIDEQAAECVMREAFSSGVDVLGEVSDELVALLTGCGVSLEQLAALGLGGSEEEASARLTALTSLFSPELQMALQLSPEARSAFADVLESQGIDGDDAECIVDVLTELEDLSQLNDLDALVGLFGDCGVSLSDLADLG